MNVLIACEESQRACIEFRNLGINAFSADLKKCSGGYPEYHIKGDVLQLLNGLNRFLVLLVLWLNNGLIPLTFNYLCFKSFSCLPLIKGYRNICIAWFPLLLCFFFHRARRVPFPEILLNKR